MILFQMIIQVSQVKNLLIRRKKKLAHFIAKREQLNYFIDILSWLPYTWFALSNSFSSPTSSLYNYLSLQSEIEREKAMNASCSDRERNISLIFPRTWLEMKYKRWTVAILSQLLLLSSAWHIFVLSSRATRTGTVQTCLLSVIIMASRSACAICSS